MNASPPTATVCAVLVTFNPDPATLAAVLPALARQVDRIVVVDNGSANAEGLAAVCRASPAVHWLALPVNRGIAHAQNAGVAMAKQLGASYIVFFDQDSSVPAGFIAHLQQQFITLSRHHRVAATVPVFRDARHGYFYPLIVLHRYGLRRKVVPDAALAAPFAVSMAISSGTFTSVAVLDDVGPLRDDFFIDYVDTEWCLRALQRGYQLYAVPAACMTHAIGDRSLRLLKWRVPLHAPFRRYYRIRNAFFLLRLRHVPLLLALREILFNNLHQLLIIATQPRRLDNVRAFGAAVRDGVSSRGGSRP